MGWGTNNPWLTMFQVLDVTVTGLGWDREAVAPNRDK